MASNSLRLVFVGGWLSYRALFGWLSPWVLIPTFLITPVFQVLFFAAIGNAAGVGDNAFYLVGNAVVAAAIPCLFATGNTIAGERWTQTLSLLLASPARRVPLFLGRAFPPILNGFAVALFTLIVGALLLRVSLNPVTFSSLAVVLLACSYSCTGIGLVTAALALRVRETAVLSNIVLGVLLVFCGVNVALSALPGWMVGVAKVLPLTHGIEAARALLTGSGWSSMVVEQTALELVIGTVYLALGLAMLRWMETESRRTASLDRA
jgi:ABC-2 type transport system permease protein